MRIFFFSCLIWIRHTLGFPEVKQEIVGGQKDTGVRDLALDDSKNRWMDEWMF